jgi:hypothetical protein
MKNKGYADNRQGEPSKCKIIPEVFYPAEEANKLLEMIRPIQGEARRLVEENPGKFPIFEWFLRSFELCYHQTGTSGPQT